VSTGIKCADVPIMILNWNGRDDTFSLHALIEGLVYRPKKWFTQS
jgi:hypothetical protein